jgi:hypothetical protein
MLMRSQEQRDSDSVLFLFSLMLSFIIPSFSSLPAYGTDPSHDFSPDTDIETLLSYASRPATNNLPPIISSFSSTNISSTGKLNVIDFGAVPNDGIEDTYAIEKTISAVNSTYNTVFFPAGTYFVEDDLRLKSKMIVEGEGKDKSIIQWTKPGISKGLNSFQIKGTEQAPIGDIIIQNLWINGTGVDTMGSCIRFEEVVGYKVTNTKLTNCGDYPNGGGIHTLSSKYGEISYNVIDKTRNGYLNPAFSILPANKTEDNLASVNGTNSGIDERLGDGNTIPKVTERKSVGSNNTLIAFNLITNSSDDAIHPQNGFDNRIIGNIVIDSHDDNIDTFRERNTIIQDNVIIMNFPSTKVNGFEIGDGSENIILKHNKVFGSSYGINIASDSLNFEPETNRNITIIENEVSGTISGCMRIVQTEHVNIIKNNFNKCNLVSTTMTGEELMAPFDSAINATLSDSPTDQNKSGGGYGMVADDSTSFMTISENNIEYIGGKNSSAGIYLGGSQFVNVTSNHMALALEERIWEGSGIFIAPSSDHVVIENNDLSGCGCLIKMMSSRSDVRVSVLEETTRIISVRIPFSFTYQVPAPSSGTEGGGGGASHYTNYTVSGESAVEIGSIQAIPSENSLILELDRTGTSAGKIGSADIEIPKQLMNKVLRVNAYSAGAESTETMGNSDDNREPKVLIIEGSDDPVFFVEHQSEQNLPFQRLATGPNSNTIRILIPEGIQRLEIKGTGGPMPSPSSFSSNGLILPSLSTSQIGILAAILSVIGALGGTIFFLGWREHRRKKIISH